MPPKAMASEAWADTDLVPISSSKAPDTRGVVVAALNALDQGTRAQTAAAAHRNHRALTGDALCAESPLLGGSIICQRVGCAADIPVPHPASTTSANVAA